MNDQHPMKHLEPHLRYLVLFTRTGLDEGGLSDSIEEICLTQETIASKILRSPKHRGVECEPKVVTQDFLLHFLKLIGRGYKLREPYFPWFYRSFVNWCLSSARRDTVRRTKPLPAHVLSRGGDPSRAAADREQRQRVLSAVRKLPFNLRIAMISQYWRRRTAREAAARQQVSIATVNRWRAEGRDRLLVLLATRGRSDAA